MTSRDVAAAEKYVWGLLEVEVYLSRGNSSYPDCATLTTWEVLFDYSSRNPPAIDLRSAKTEKTETTENFTCQVYK